MGTRLYVGNLPFSFTSTQLQDLFAPHGTVISAQVIIDRLTNRSRGFGFVEMETAEAADKAIQALNGRPVEGRSLSVSVAKQRPGGGPGGGGPGGGGGGGGPRGPGRGGFDRGSRGPYGGGGYGGRG